MDILTQVFQGVAITGAIIIVAGIVYKAVKLILE